MADTGTDFVVWAVGLLFYLPLHLGLPLLSVLVNGRALNKRWLKPYFGWGLIWAGVTFAVAIILIKLNIWWAIAAIVFSLPQPWWHIHRLLNKP